MVFRGVKGDFRGMSRFFQGGLMEFLSDVSGCFGGILGNILCFFQGCYRVPGWSLGVSWMIQGIFQFV